MKPGWWLLAILAMLVMSCQGAAESKAPEAANATYTVEGRSVTLSNGVAEEAAAPGSATKIRTKLSEMQAVGDLDGDRKPDIVVVLIRDPGGSGTFYYLAAVLNDAAGVGKATNAQLLGDRIVVENLSVGSGQITVEYLTRREREPMAAAPSVKVTKKFAVKDSKLVEAP